jgi:hypothetical protein
MWIVVIIIVLIVFALITFVFLKRSGDTIALLGTTKDLEDSIVKLMQSTKKRAFVIAKVHGTNDFVRFNSDTKSVELDFPLVSDMQKSMEEAFRSIAKKMNLKVVKNIRSGGQTFLDINIKGTTAEISVVGQTFIEKFFKVDQDTKIEYELNV